MDRLRQYEPERPDFAALDGGSERPRLERALVASLEVRIHALAELGQLRLRPLAPKQVTAQLVLELLDGPSQRRLRHVALLSGLGEIQLANRSQEISDLMHLHGKASLGHFFHDACRAYFSQRSRNSFVTTAPATSRCRTGFRSSGPPLPSRCISIAELYQP